MIGYGNSYFISTILDSGGGVSGIPVNTVAPVISGGTSLGSVLSSTTGTWTGDPTITYAYQWKRNGNNIGGATNSTYTITIFDAGANITCTITATNGVGSTQATSNTINVQAFSAPVNTVAPVISGTSVVGYTLSSTDGTWTGNPTPTYTYQWYRGVNAIGGATSNTYTLVNADEGQSITCQVTGTNGIGSSTATSNALTVSSLVLDLYPNSAVAYSLRKLRTAYSGSAIRVRRSVDNAEQDIAFSGNDLDTQTMLDFVGANLWTFSEEWDNVAWTKNGLNTTGTPAYVNVETAPDSTLTADKIIENTISASHLTARQFAVTNGVTYNVSVYLKSGGRDARVTSGISNLATYQVDVDLTNGTLSGNTFPTSPVLDSVGSGWYRLSYSVTAANTQTRTAITIITKNGASTNYLGDGTSGVFVWGAQISESATVKTYQKTVATAGGNGFVTTWYDQSTNANNSTQATAANQAQIVASGALILDVDTSKITTTWTADKYALTSGISTNTKYFSISMFRRGTNTSDVLFHLGNSISTTPRTLAWLASSSSYSVSSSMPTTLVFENVSTMGRCIMTSLRDAANLKVGYRNGVQLTITATEAPTSQTLNAFGQSGSILTTSGQYQEYIYWDSEQSANRTGIEDNIKTYWNAY